MDQTDNEGNIDQAVQATVTIASLIGSSIGEAQKECKEVGPMYDYLSNNHSQSRLTNCCSVQRRETG